MGKGPKLKTDFVIVDPRLPINQVLGTELDELCRPELDNEDPCLYYDNRMFRYVEIPKGVNHQGEIMFGLASYYSAKLHGRCTSVQSHYDPVKKESICKRYDHYDDYVASNVYAPGTVLEITDLATGASVLAIVGDYGPNKRFGAKDKAASRIVDLSAALFLKLHGDLADGIIPVKTRVINSVTLEFLPDAPQCIDPSVYKAVKEGNISNYPYTISIGSTNMLDALRVMLDISKEYPDNLRFRKSGKGSIVWKNNRKKPHSVKIQRDIVPNFYETILIFSPNEYDLYKMAIEYVEGKNNWGLKYLFVETGSK